MRLERDRLFKLMRRFRSVPSIMAFAMGVGILIGMSGFLVNADQTGVAPPQGSAPLLEVVADGVQIYTCEAKGSLFQWDGSAIVGEVVAKADAPEKDAIEALLLRAKAHEGQGVLGEAAFIRRTDTKGGIAPTAGCDANHVAEQVRIRYSAVYQFFSAPKG